MTSIRVKPPCVRHTLDVLTANPEVLIIELSMK